MSAPQPDVAHQLADALLGHILDRLATVNATPGRAFVCGESTIPADDCCNGLVWVRVANITPTDGSGASYRTLLPASTPTPPGHVIKLEAGALRCAPTVDQKGRPPKPDLYTASALTSAQDRAALRRAVICDLPADITALNADGQIPGQWVPLYTGDCAGGYLTTDIVTTIVI